MRGCLKKTLQRQVKHVARAWYPLCRIRNRVTSGEEVRILMYHKVSPLHPEGNVSYCNTSIPAFEAQMKYLTEAGIEVLTLEQMEQWLSGARPLRGAQGVVITFDDGFQDNYLYAYPILKKYRLPAIFCVIVGPINRDVFFDHLQWDQPALADRAAHPEHWRPMTWDMLEEMAENGMSIGSHTLSHRSLGTLNHEEVWDEVFRSKKILEERLQRPVSAFSYPFGSAVYGDFNASTESALRKAGYTVAWTTRWGGNRVGENAYRLKRIPIYDHDTLLDFQCKVHGATDWMDSLKCLWQRSTGREDKTQFVPSY